MSYETLGAMMTEIASAQSPMITIRIKNPEMLAKQESAIASFALALAPDTGKKALTPIVYQAIISEIQKTFAEHKPPVDAEIGIVDGAKLINKDTGTSIATSPGTSFLEGAAVGAGVTGLLGTFFFLFFRRK